MTSPASMAMSISGSSRFAHLFGVGLPLIFIPIMAASYDGIPPDKTDQASALINAARNVGSSIGIALAINVLAHRQQFHQSRLVEHVFPSKRQYQGTLQQVTDYFTAMAARPPRRRSGPSPGSAGRCRPRRRCWPISTSSGSMLISLAPCRLRSSCARSSPAGRRPATDALAAGPPAARPRPRSPRLTEKSVRSTLSAEVVA